MSIILHIKLGRINIKVHTENTFIHGIPHTSVSDQYLFSTQESTRSLRMRSEKLSIHFTGSRVRNLCRNENNRKNGRRELTKAVYSLNPPSSVIAPSKNRRTIFPQASPKNKDGRIPSPVRPIHIPAASPTTNICPIFRRAQHIGKVCAVQLI